MKTSLSAAVLSVLASVFITGCGVTQQAHDELKQAWRTAVESLKSAEARNAELEQELAELRKSPAENARRIAELEREKADLVAKLTKLRTDYAKLADRKPAEYSPLPKELDAKLKAFAAANPNLVEYDPKRGMVKFRSDVTFALGSAQLRPSAAATLATLAGILNDPVASTYEVRVVGHTDTVPIKRAATKAKHPTNWHLSVHRAISVRDSLEQSGIDAFRTAVSGYGPYRPNVQNAKGGAEPNRRVEIFLVAMRTVNRNFVTPIADATKTDNVPEKRPAIPLK